MVTNKNMNNVLHNWINAWIKKYIYWKNSTAPYSYSYCVWPSGHYPFKVKQDLTFTPMSVIKPFFFHEDYGLFSIWFIPTLLTIHVPLFHGFFFI